LISRGKSIGELSREELIQCALHFRKAHVETTLRLAEVLRRMSKMELGLTKEQIATIDWWLSKHAHDANRGDGKDLYWPWTEFQLTPNGYRAKGDRF
jgi:hypothetical protein